MSIGKSIMEERTKIRGPYAEQAQVAQTLKIIFRDRHKNWSKLTVVQQESLDNIANKLARILTGDPAEHDSWADISGYAELVLRSMRGG